MNFNLIYSLESMYDFSHKLQFKFDLNNFINEAHLSALVAKKQRYAESATTKLDNLFLNLVGIRPIIKLTNSLIVFNSVMKGSKLWLFMLDYLKETGRYTISPFSIHKNQVNFIFNDYNFLANFLGVKYDFFNWRYSIRVCLNLKTSNKLVLKMLLLSLVTDKVY